MHDPPVLSKKMMENDSIIAFFSTVVSVALATRAEQILSRLYNFFISSRYDGCEEERTM